MYNVVFFATDYVQWLPNTLHCAFPRAGDEVQQLWLLQYCTRRGPHAAAAADRAEHWGWGRNRAAYPAPVSYTTLKQHTTNKDGYHMTSTLKPKYLRCNDKKGNLCRVSEEAPVADVAMFCFLLGGGGWSFKPKCLCRTCWSWVSVKTVPHRDGSSTG